MLWPWSGSDSTGWLASRTPVFFSGPPVDSSPLSFVRIGDFYRFKRL